MLKKTIPMTCAALLTVAVPLSVSAKELSAVEILGASNAAMAELESYASETTMELTVPPLLEDTPTSVVIHSEEQLTLKPFGLHQTVTTVLPDGEQMTELYWTEEGLYQKDPVSGWVQLPNELFGDVDALLSKSMTGQMPAKAALFGDKLAVEDLGDSFLLTYEGDGKALTAYVQGMLEAGLGEKELSLMFGSMLGEITFNELSYDMVIDQETFYVTEMTGIFDMDVTVAGEAVNLTQSIDVSLSDFNNVGPIVIPEEVTSVAVPLDLAELEEEGSAEGGEQSSGDEQTEEGSAEGGEQSSGDEQTEGEELPDTASSDPATALGGFALAALGGGLLLTRRKSATQ